MYDCIECLRPLEKLECCSESYMQGTDTKYSIVFCDRCQVHYLIVDREQEEQLTSNHLIYALTLTLEEKDELCPVLADPELPGGKEKLLDFINSRKEDRLIMKDRQYDPWY